MPSPVGTHSCGQPCLPLPGPQTPTGQVLSPGAAALATVVHTDKQSGKRADHHQGQVKVGSRCSVPRRAPPGPSAAPSCLGGQTEQRAGTRVVARVHKCPPTAGDTGANLEPPPLSVPTGRGLPWLGAAHDSERPTWAAVCSDSVAPVRMESTGHPPSTAPGTGPLRPGVFGQKESKRSPKQEGASGTGAARPRPTGSVPLDTQGRPRGPRALCAHPPSLGTGKGPLPGPGGLACSP